MRHVAANRLAGTTGSVGVRAGGRPLASGRAGQDLSAEPPSVFRLRSAPATEHMLECAIALVVFELVE
jgi:hypothetical protein